MFKHHGRISYNAHPATPLVVGDFEVMKQWAGHEDGDLEGPYDVAGVEVVGFAADDLAAPNVYTDASSIVMLVEAGSYSAERDIPVEEVQAVLAATNAVHERFQLEVTSGALVISVQYNATPELGAKTAHLSTLTYYPGVPVLPATPPAEVCRLHTDQATLLRESMIIPMANGSYELRLGHVDGFERFDIERRASVRSSS